VATRAQRVVMARSRGSRTWRPREAKAFTRIRVRRVQRIRHRPHTYRWPHDFSSRNFLSRQQSRSGALFKDVGVQPACFMNSGARSHLARPGRGRVV